MSDDLTQALRGLETSPTGQNFFTAQAAGSEQIKPNKINKMKPKLNRPGILNTIFFAAMALLAVGAGVHYVMAGPPDLPGWAANAGLVMAALPITNEGALEMVRNLYKTNITALNGILDKLPESLRGEMKALHDSLNEKLSKLPPIEQVAGANQAGWALECLSDTVNRVQAYAQGLMDKLSQLGTEYAGKLTELNGMKAQVTAGELLTKDKVTVLVDSAREEGKKLVQPEIMALRKKSVELAGLPLPPDNILQLPTAEFEPALTAAQANVAKMGERGLKIGGKGENWVRQSAWMPASEFAGQMKTIEEFLPASQGTVDPLLGNQGGGAAAGGEKKPKITLA